MAEIGMGDGAQSPVQVTGWRSGRSRPVSSVDDSGTERLAVDARVTNAVLEMNLDYTDDEVTIAGSTDGGTTRKIVRTDTTGNQGVYLKTTSAAFADSVSNTESFTLAENGTLQVVVPFNYVCNGVTWDRLRGNTLGLLVQGSTAHGVVAAGNPLHTGGHAVAHGSNPAAVDAGDITHAIANRAGVPFTIGGHPNIQTSQYISTGTITDDNLLPVIATGTKYVITRITVTVDEATTVGVGFRVGFGSTAIPAAPSTNADAVAGILLTHAGLVPGGGITVGDGSGILGVGGDGEELRVTVSDTPTSGSIHFNVSWYTIES